MAGREFYNPFVCDFEFNAAGDYFRTDCARCNRCDALLNVDADVLKDHATMAHSEELPPAYFNMIIGLAAHIPGHEPAAAKPIGCAWPWDLVVQKALRLPRSDRVSLCRKAALVPHTVMKLRTKECTPPIPTAVLDDIECETMALTAGAQVAALASAARVEDHRTNAVGHEDLVDTLSDGLGSRWQGNVRTLQMDAMAVEAEIMSSHASQVAAQHYGGTPLPPLHRVLQEEALLASSS